MRAARPASHAPLRAHWLRDGHHWRAAAGLRRHGGDGRIGVDFLTVPNSYFDTRTAHAEHVYYTNDDLLAACLMVRWTR